MPTSNQRAIRVLETASGWNNEGLPMPRQQRTPRQLLHQPPRKLRPRALKKSTVTKGTSPSAAINESSGSRKRRGFALSMRSKHHQSRALAAAVTRFIRGAAAPGSSCRTVHAAGVKPADAEGGFSTNTMAQCDQAKASRRKNNPAGSRNRPVAHRRRHPVVQAMKPSRGILRKSSTPPRTPLQNFRRRAALLKTKKVKFSLQAREQGAAYSPVPPSLMSTPIKYFSGVMGSTLQSLSTALFGEGTGGAGDVRGDSSNDHTTGALDDLRRGEGRPSRRSEHGTHGGVQRRAWRRVFRWRPDIGMHGERL